MATPRNGVTQTKDRLPGFVKGLKKLERRDVLVGIPDDAGHAGESRGPQAGKNARDDGGPNNAQLGYIHDQGSPDVGIPQREFLAPGVREGRPRFTPHLKAAAVATLAGDKNRADKSLASAGLEAMNAVQTKLKTGPFVPLAPATIARRRRRSAGSSYRRKATTASDVKPLIDTSQMLRAVTYVVRGGK